MTPTEQAQVRRALRRVRESAFPPGEFVGQEGFMSASEILALAERAGIAPGVGVLDLCCGVGGPGLFVTRRLGCTYLGVDASPDSIAEARRAAGDADLAVECRVARIPPVPHGPFEVVLLLETVLAFRDKRTLLRQVSAALSVGGRFAFTVEEGTPLTDAERRAMPRAETVWPAQLPDLAGDLEHAGLRVTWSGECSRSHQATVEALADAYAATAPDLRAMPGPCIVDDLLASHRLWSRWLREGRVRKFAVVAEKVGSPREPRLRAAASRGRPVAPLGGRWDREDPS